MSDVKQRLDENIPKEVIKTRVGGGNRELSYLETWYVIDRLNQVLGQGNWAYSSEVNCVHNGTVKTQYGEAYSVHYIARVRLVVNVDERDTEFTDYGYGDGTDKSNPGKAHELAVKEAVSDGLKRCAKNLGRSMGLALYDKSQEFVGTRKENSGAKTGNKVSDTTNPSDGSTKISKIDGTKTSSKKTTSGSTTSSSSTKDVIGAAYETLKAQGKITAEDFKKRFLNNTPLSQLTPAGAETVLIALRVEYKELSL